MTEPKLSLKQDSLSDLTERLRAFGAARDWEQFHSPKNLVMALTAELGELTEHFQWLTEAESKQIEATAREKVESEIADVFIYLVRLAQVLEVDLLSAADRKISENERKYPIEKVRGSAKKYSDY
jgi:NTP pyrophosphatase (non-canonical NTP hydrolase)